MPVGYAVQHGRLSPTLPDPGGPVDRCARGLRSDNGGEFTAETLHGFLAARKITPVFIDAGCPWQNPICERYNGSMAEELLDVESFHKRDRGAGARRPLEPDVQHGAAVSLAADEDPAGVLRGE